MNQDRKQVPFCCDRRICTTGCALYRLVSCLCFLSAKQPATGTLPSLQQWPDSPALCRKCNHGLSIPGLCNCRRFSRAVELQRCSELLKLLSASLHTRQTQRHCLHSRLRCDHVLACTSAQFSAAMFFNGEFANAFT